MEFDKCTNCEKEIEKGILFYDLLFCKVYYCSSCFEYLSGLACMDLTSSSSCVDKSCVICSKKIGKNSEDFFAGLEILSVHSIPKNYVQTLSFVCDDCFDSLFCFKIK